MTNLRELAQALKDAYEMPRTDPGWMHRQVKIASADLAFREATTYQAILALYERIPEWISVEDRLPTNAGMQHYLVVLRIGSMSVKTKVSTMIFKMDGCGGKFLAGDWAKVSHWLPLPEPPAQE